MADQSITNIPNLSIATLDSSGASAPSFTLASSASLLIGGHSAFTGNASFAANLVSTSTINQTALASKLLSKQTTASYTSLTLADGELTIGSVSATSCRLVFRSGATTYEFWANRAAIL